MLHSTLNLYDLIKFPNGEIRANLRNNYSAFSELKLISINPVEKYNEVPCEFIDYQTIVVTWIKEYNYAIYILNIPLFQMLDVYESMASGDVNKEQLPYYLFLFNYYCELLAYYIDCAFKKSVNIFNAIFKLNINDELNSFMKIIEEIRRRSKSNKIINKTNFGLKKFKDNRYYQDIIKIRNRNTVSA